MRQKSTGEKELLKNERKKKKKKKKERKKYANQVNKMRQE